jgi:hypothetical protein
MRGDVSPKSIFVEVAGLATTLVNRDQAIVVADRTATSNAHIGAAELIMVKAEANDIIENPRTPLGVNHEQHSITESRVRCG